MRRCGLVLLAACGAGAGHHRVAAPGVFVVAVPGPARDLGWKGVDSRVGAYAVGACTLSYDAGMYQGGLVPRPGLRDWAYRVTLVDGRAARWARFAVADAESGAYQLALYVPGLEIQVACPSAAERDAAVAWLETVRFDPRFDRTGGRDLTTTRAITGPAAWSPAPVWCEHRAGAAEGGAGDATLVVESMVGPRLASVVAIPVGTGAAKATFLDEPSATAKAVLPAGTYQIDVSSTQQETVSCGELALAPGQVMTVRVRRFGL
jgi:hypothetical protein